MTVLAIAVASWRRLARDRTALFFLLVLPVLVIVIVGATVRGFSTFRVGVVDLGAGRAGRELTQAIGRAPGLAVARYESREGLETAVARGEVTAGVVLPRGMTEDERGGRKVTVVVLAEQANSSEQAAAASVSAVVAARGATVQAARFATSKASGSYDENFERATRLAGGLDGVGLRQVTAERTANVLPEGFGYSAPTELVLFVFLSALAGAASTIESRRLGMFERMAAAPVSSRAIIAGESVSFFSIALVQSLTIVVIGAIAFGVSWGDPLAAGALLVTWSLVGASAAMLSATLFRTPEQASAIGPVVGIAFGMLGGCMWPLAIVSDTMRQVGHLTPQAWAIDAWTDLLARHGGLAAIVPELGILLGFAGGFFLLATARLRRVLS